MQRFLLTRLLLILALYGSLTAFATDSGMHAQSDNLPESASMRHIALLLPLESPVFGEAANRVKEGFSIAAMREQALPLITRIYATTDDPLDILVTYQQAITAGALFVVGPLTRDGVSAIASSQRLNVPTLALNTVDNILILPANLYLFGLQMESEAGQIARLAQTSGRRHAIIIGDDSAVSKRLQSAFAQQWQSESGNTADSLYYVDNPEVLQQFRSLTAGANHVVFLALDADRVHRLHSFLDPEVPVYATSQIFTGSDNILRNNDLNGIQFMDMPWLLQPDHPAVMAYRHAAESHTADMERLYALGIDAFRVMAYLLQSRPAREVSFDGVTGYVRFADPSQFVREPVAAQFVQGRVQLLDLQKTAAEPNEGQ